MPADTNITDLLQSSMNRQVLSALRRDALPDTIAGRDALIAALTTAVTDAYATYEVESA